MAGLPGAGSAEPALGSAPLPENLVEAPLDAGSLLLDVVVVDGDDLQALEIGRARRRGDVGARGIAAVGGKIFQAVSPIMNSANSLAAFGLGEPFTTEVGEGMTNTPSEG